jgi:uncharacterized protein YndB with AHSA1/START domain
LQVFLIRHYETFWDENLRNLKKIRRGKPMNPTDVGDAIVREIVINAPAERIFEALTNPEHRVKWWGAQEKFQTTHMESDLRPGGAWLMRGSGPGGKPFTLRGKYRSIERPRLLEFTWLDDGQEDIPLTLISFDLDEKGGSTTVRLTHWGFTTEQSRERYQGWPWILALLQAYVQDKENKGPR